MQRNQSAPKNEDRIVLHERTPRKTAATAKQIADSVKNFTTIIKKGLSDSKILALIREQANFGSSNEEEEISTGQASTESIIFTLWVCTLATRLLMKMVMTALPVVLFLFVRALYIKFDRLKKTFDAALGCVMLFNWGECGNTLGLILPGKEHGFQVQVKFVVPQGYVQNNAYEVILPLAASNVFVLVAIALALCLFYWVLCKLDRSFSIITGIVKKSVRLLDQVPKIAPSKHIANDGSH